MNFYLFEQELFRYLLQFSRELLAPGVLIVKGMYSNLIWVDNVRGQCVAPGGKPISINI